ncbi:MAG: alkaline phosphatase family protein [Ignavibacteriales bacterium]|nr:alkaline phosphatase family protein [Ignavibacteriales bacterium]
MHPFLAEGLYPVKRAVLFLSILIASAVIAAEASERPKLVIYISIDQMKAEYLDWYKAEFIGGFKRFLKDGTVFTNADLNFAPSETGPGHAALGTGAYPAHSGILSNEWLDPKSGSQDYCVQDSSAGKVDGEGGGVSPRMLMVTGLGDWWKQAIPHSKVVSASIKDRAAILMSGQHPDYAFWYDRKSGHMVTSDYYVRHLPEWVKTFNEEDWVQHNLPDAWTKLLPDSMYTKYGPDELPGEQQTDGSTSFPHAYPREKKKSLLPSGPFGDAMVLDFARAAVRSEQLGQRGVSDLLTISLSCADYVGHAYGGNSHELIDLIIRLDRALGEFFADMENIVGAGNVLFVLSGDHAAMPLPEYLSSVKHTTGRRVLVRKEVYPKIEALDQKLQRELGTRDHIIKSNAFLNYAAASMAGVDSVALERRVKEGLLRIDGIAGVYFRREILHPASRNKPFVGYYQKGYYPPRGRDFLILPRKNYLFTTSTTGTTHGTPYSYDTHVPMLFLGKGMKPARITNPAQTVDIAPTIARLMGIPFPKTVDGIPRKELVR